MDEINQVRKVYEEKQMYNAYTEVINEYSSGLFNYGIRFCEDEEVVRDCIQQMFFDLWNKAFDVSRRDTLKSYLFKAIRNRVLREKAKWSQHQNLDIGEKQNDNLAEGFLLEFGVEQKLIEQTADIELAQKIKRMLNNLPARQREIIYLRFYIGLDIIQISNVMDINRQSAHNLLQKAYRKLRGDWQLFGFILAIIKLSDIKN